MCSSDIFLGVLAILFPPLPVWVKRGVCSADSLINILLLVLGFIPGLIHAWYIIAKYPDPDYEYEAVPHQDSEAGRGGGRHAGRVRYIIIDRADVHNYAKPPQQGPNYGTAGGNQGGNSSNGGNGNKNASYAAAAAAPVPQQQGVMDAGEGSSDNNGVPPSYADVVAGDNKIQTKD